MAFASQVHENNDNYDDQVICIPGLSLSFLEGFDIESEEKSSSVWDNVAISDMFLMRIEVSIFAIRLPDR